MKILFVGKKRSGKDTAADYFKAWYGGQSFSFAKPIYDIMYYYQDTLGIKHFKDRKFLQVVGSLARAYDPNIWINILKRKVANIDHTKTNIYVTDGRYLNELDEMRACGYLLVNVICPEEIRVTRLDPEDSVNDSHESENGYPSDYSFDAVIINDGTLEEFHDKLKVLINGINKSTNSLARCTFGIH